MHKFLVVLAIFGLWLAGALLWAVPWVLVVTLAPLTNDVSFLGGIVWGAFYGVGANIGVLTLWDRWA